MNREIKFRGKSVDDGKFPETIWVRGFLTILKIGNHRIQYQSENHKWDYVNVIPETVGQFTGLRDKNGVEVYEGDIIRFILFYNEQQSLNIKEYIGEVNFKDYGYVAECYEVGCKEEFEYFELGFIKFHSRGEIEVIANIHDNQSRFNNQ